jgi:hypothetical protein
MSSPRPLRSSLLGLRLRAYSRTFPISIHYRLSAIGYWLLAMREARLREARACAERLEEVKKAS